MGMFLDNAKKTISASATPGRIAKNPKDALDPYNVFTKPDIDVPKIVAPPPAPGESQADKDSMAEEARKERQRARGRAATVYTGDFGDTSAPTTARRTLLGQ